MYDTTIINKSSIKHINIEINGKLQFRFILSDIGSN